MHGDDILSVIFLALICIVISGIVMKTAPKHSNLIIPSFAVIAVGLWIAYDYMLRSRLKKVEQQMNNVNSKQVINDLVDEINARTALGGAHEPEHNAAPDNGKPKDPDAKEDVDDVPEPVKQGVYEFDIDMYNGQNIQEVFMHMANSGDTQICNRMKYMGMQSKLSEDIRASFNKHSLEPYFVEELRENEALRWWGDNDDIYGDI
jgi:hypothetical protein